MQSMKNDYLGTSIDFVYSEIFNHEIENFKTTTVLVLNMVKHTTIWNTIYISFRKDHILHCKFDSKWFIYDKLCK